MVAIIADLHDHLVNFTVFLDKIAEMSVDELWIAGDIGTPETLVAVTNQFHGVIRAVAGNVELGHGAHHYGLIAADSPRVHWTKSAPLVWNMQNNEPTISQVAMYHHPPSARQLVQQPCNLLVFGHTHRPSLEKRAEIWHLNPGTLGGVFLPATYALADLIQPKFTLHRLYE